MIILAIEVSGQVCGAAVTNGEVISAEFNIQLRKTHSQSLMPMIEDIFSITGLERTEVDAVAVTKGPGSFTGVRIGAATAKGLAMVLGKPVIGVPTVDAVAYNLAGTEGLICPILDARRDQVYTGIYEFRADEAEESGETFETLQPQCARSIDETVQTLNEMGRSVVFTGDGVPVYRERIARLVGVPYRYAPMHLAVQRAGATAALAALMYRREGSGCFTDPDAFRPEYLRLSQAERARAEGVDTSMIRHRD